MHLWLTCYFVAEFAHLEKAFFINVIWRLPDPIDPCVMRDQQFNNEDRELSQALIAICVVSPNDLSTPQLRN